MPRSKQTNKVIIIIIIIIAITILTIFIMELNNNNDNNNSLVNSVQNMFQQQSFWSKDVYVPANHISS
jgi:uncharacterized protein YxeA